MDLSDKSSLNRSFSAPDISPSQSIRTICRRFVVQEVYQQDSFDVSLVRQLSCEEIYDNHYQRKLHYKEHVNKINAYNREIPFTLSGFSNALNFCPQRGTMLMCGDSTNQSSSEIPMDVDLDEHTDIREQTVKNYPCSRRLVNKMHNEKDRQSVFKEATAKQDRNETDMEEDSTSEMLINETRRRQNKDTEELMSDIVCKKQRNYLTKLLPLSLMVILVVLLYKYTYVYRNIVINESDVVQNIEHELKTSVLHQKEALSIVIDSLQSMNMKKDFRKVLLFIGSTGVGKTFVANIIKKHMPENLVHEVNLIDIRRASQGEIILKAIDENHCNLLIIEDLKSAYVYSVLDFVMNFANVKCLLVIPIFNIEETNDNLVLRVRYDKIENIWMTFHLSYKFDFELVQFNVMNEDVVERWLETLLPARNLDRDKISGIIKELLEQQDVKNYGFKGIDAKLNLLEYN